MSRTRGLDPERRLRNYLGEASGVARDAQGNDTGVYYRVKSLTPKQRRRLEKKARTLDTRWSGRAQR